MDSTNNDQKNDNNDEIDPQEEAWINAQIEVNTEVSVIKDESSEVWEKLAEKVVLDGSHFQQVGDGPYRLTSQMEVVYLRSVLQKSLPESSLTYHICCSYPYDQFDHVIVDCLKDPKHFLFVYDFPSMKFVFVLVGFEWKIGLR